MTLAPDPMFPERAPQTYEAKIGANRGGNKGDERFFEGLASDTDVPTDFGRGSTEALQPAPGSLNHVNPETQFKHAAETMQERAHMGSASWIEAPSMLGEFASAAMQDYDAPRYEEVQRSGSRYQRPNPTVRD